VVTWTLLSFILGSLPFSLWMGRLIARADIRRYGDGNPGAFNAWRAGGWQAGIPALLLDFLKGAMPVALAHYGAGLGGWALVMVSLAPILGHAFSPWLRLRGGKAIAVTFGVWTGLTLWVGPITLGFTLGLALAAQRTDAWSAVLGMAALLVVLLLRASPWPFLAIWAGNLAVLLWRHRAELREPPQVRPWLRKVWKREPW
jgi:glycerol-3-phosphate acyltransferase PlsY